MAKNQNKQCMRYLAMVSAVVLCGSAFLSWGSVATESVVGIQGDGMITLFLGIAAILFLLKRRLPLYIPTILGLLAFAVALWDYLSISEVMLKLTITSSIGLGLYLTLVSSFLLTVFSFIQWRKIRIRA